MPIENGNDNLPPHLKALYGYSVVDSLVGGLIDYGRSRFHTVAGGVGWVNSNRSMVAIMVMPSLFIVSHQIIDAHLFGPQRKAEAVASAQAQDATRQAAEAAVKKDFEETAGANMLRAGDGTSYIVTLRGSASLAASREEWLSGVLGRVRTASGCNILAVSYLPGDTPSGFFGNSSVAPRRNEAYVITTNCPKL